MKVSTIFISVTALAAGLALAAPAPSEHDVSVPGPTPGPKLDNRETSCIAMGNCGGIYTAKPVSRLLCL